MARHHGSIPVRLRGVFVVSYRHDSSLLIIHVDSVDEARFRLVELGHIELSITGCLVLIRPIVAFVSASRDLPIEVV